MTFGPGKYDDLCTVVRDLTDADAVMLCVIEGNRGSGFSSQLVVPHGQPPDYAASAIAASLRAIADQIEADAKKQPQPGGDTWIERK